MSDKILKFFTLMDDQGGFVVQGIQVPSPASSVVIPIQALGATPLPFCLTDHIPI